MPVIFENHIAVVMRSTSILAFVTLCILIPFEVAHARKIASGIHDLEFVKHKGTVKSIEGKNGEVIDCVDIYKQPAFDHPLLKNHTIQMQPSSIQNGVKSENEQKMLLQEWHENGECPEGTIPITREPNSVYPRKAYLNLSLNGPSSENYVDPSTGHEYAQVTLNGGRRNYYGVRATLNLWTPTTIAYEFSLAQVWVVSGRAEKMNTLEAGWIVNSGDKYTKLFIFWTSDGYQRTGCYNLQCPGFVQVNNRIALGSNLGRVSTYNGPQSEIEIYIFKNKESGHWWLQLGNTAVGYWPGSIFTTLAESSDAISCGGEIVNANAGGHHTQTDMGSGHFASEGFKKASHVRNIKYIDVDGTLRDPVQLIPYASKPSCYSLLIGRNKNLGFGRYFYFGGPGYSRSCQT